jgi:hypothetical protein
MSISYLENKWENISREERYFCLILFERIRQNPKEFVCFLNDKLKTNFDINQEWDAGYEVCFYRDYLKSFNKGVKYSDYSQKRTFDLCLFSEKNIVIIEAKCQQKFNKKDIENFIKDKKLIPMILSREIKVDVIGLISSIYIKNLAKYGCNEIKSFFNNDNLISWLSLYEKYLDTKFMRADKIYKK